MYFSCRVLVIKLFPKQNLFYFENSSSTGDKKLSPFWLGISFDSLLENCAFRLYSFRFYTISCPSFQCVIHSTPLPLFFFSLSLHPPPKITKRTLDPMVSRKGLWDNWRARTAVRVRFYHPFVYVHKDRLRKSRQEEIRGCYKITFFLEISNWKGMIF